MHGGLQKLAAQAASTVHLAHNEIFEMSRQAFPRGVARVAKGHTHHAVFRRIRQHTDVVACRHIRCQLGFRHGHLLGGTLKFSQFPNQAQNGRNVGFLCPTERNIFELRLHWPKSSTFPYL